MAIGSSKYSLAWSLLIEMEMLSTPSMIAWSKATNKSSPANPTSQQTLYTASLVEGAMPLVVPPVRLYS